MLPILFTRSLLNSFTLSLNSFTLNLILFQKNSPINTFYSQSPILSKTEATTPSSFDKREEKSKRVISLLKTHGFTETQISKLVRLNPSIIYADPQKTIAPKIDFFLSIGISNTDLPKFVSSDPFLLKISLNNKLIPCHRFLKNMLIRDDNVVKMIKRRSRILSSDVNRTIAPNISLLTGIGVPKSAILFMLIQAPNSVLKNHAQFKRIVEEVIKMGFNPNRCTFIHAVQVLSQMSKLTWKRKWEAYRYWGLSDDEISMAFRSHPICMSLSEQKIERGMDFLVNKMGWEAVNVAKSSSILFFNLEKRIIPRCRVIGFLISEGILKKDLALSTFLKPTEEYFLAKYVSKYQYKIPGLLNVYLGKKGGLETGHGSMEKSEMN